MSNWGDSWSWGSQDFSYSPAKGGGKSGKGKSGKKGGASSSGYAPEWYDWGSGKGGGGGRYQNNQNYALVSSVRGLTTMMENHGWTSWEKEQAQIKKDEEAAARLAKEAEAEERKKERDAMYERMREDRQELMKALTLRQNPGGGSGGGSAAHKGPPAPEPPEDGGVLDSYKAILRGQTGGGGGGGGAPKQRALAPIDAATWKDWTADNAAVRKIQAKFPTLVTQDEVRGENILSIAETLNGVRNIGTKAELAQKFEELSGEAPHARWAKLDILVASLVEILSDT